MHTWMILSSPRAYTPAWEGRRPPATLPACREKRQEELVRHEAAMAARAEQAEWEEQVRRAGAEQVHEQHAPPAGASQRNRRSWRHCTLRM